MASIWPLINFISNTRPLGPDRPQIHLYGIHITDTTHDLSMPLKVKFDSAIGLLHMSSY